MRIPIRFPSVRASQTAFLALLAFAAATYVHADAGDIDTTYGNGGIAIANPATGVTDIAATLLQPDNKLVVAGRCVGPGDSAANSFCMVRFNTDGSVDTNGFNANDPIQSQRGKVVYSPGVGSNELVSATLRTDGRILLIGNCQISSQILLNTICVAQFLRNGSIDSAFATNGLFRAPTDLAGNAWVGAIAYRIAEQANDGLLIAATFSAGLNNLSFVIGRLTSTGAIDSAFGPLGAVAVTAILYDVADVLYLPSDQFVYAGRCGNSFLSVCAQRVNTAPVAIDQTFGNGGLAGLSIVDQSTPYLFQARTLQQQTNGAILVGGACGTSTPSRLCLARISAGGLVDATFAPPLNAVIAPVETGTVTGNEPRGIRDIAVQSDGRIVGVGQCAQITSLEPLTFANRRCVMRVNTDGTPDTTFGASAGIAYSSPGGVSPTAFGVAELPTGNLLVAGSCSSTTEKNYCITRHIGATKCSMDIDGDGEIIATLDGLIITRAMLGFAGSAVLQGLSFSPNARRSTWAQISNYLAQQCGMTLAP
jgi:uncharacterized delta-60 repeat protein